MLDLSVTIIAGAEEENIRECLESVRWAGEIIVVNSYSGDRTADIAREYTPNVFLRKWEGYASQKQFALDQAKHEWVLSLDADERVSPELKDEIAAVVQSEKKCDGYRIPRRSYFLNKWIRSCGWYPGYQTRLFRRTKVRLTNRLVHEGFDVDGRLGTLTGDIIHRTHPTIRVTIQKINEYSTLEAAEKFRTRKITIAGLLTRPIVAFLQMFLFRGGYRDGAYGAMVSLIHAMTRALTMMKIWEMQHSIPQDKKER